MTTSTAERPAKVYAGPDLFGAGYSVRAVPSATFGTFIVTSPAGNQYRIQAIEGTCTCPGYVTHRKPCRHLKGLDALVSAVWAVIDDRAERAEAMYRLAEEMDAVKKLRR